MCKGRSSHRWCRVATSSGGPSPGRPLAEFGLLPCARCAQRDHQLFTGRVRRAVRWPGVTSSHWAERLSRSCVSKTQRRSIRCADSSQPTPACARITPPSAAAHSLASRTHGSKNTPPVGLFGYSCPVRPAGERWAMWAIEYQTSLLSGGHVLRAEAPKPRPERERERELYRDR